MEELDWFWDNLTKRVKIQCLKQAERGEVDPPKGIPSSVYNIFARFLSDRGYARLAKIEGGGFEAIKLECSAELALRLLDAEAKERKQQTNHNNEQQ